MQRGGGSARIEREEDNSETGYTLVSLSARILDETSAKRREEVFGEGVLECERMEMGRMRNEISGEG